MNLILCIYLTQRRVNTFYEITYVDPGQQAQPLLNSKFALPISCEEKRFFIISLEEEGGVMPEAGLNK